MITRISLRRLIVNFIRVVEVIAAFFLSLRIVFEALPVNSSTPFVAWIYKVSSNLMYPFSGIVRNTPTGGGGVFDWVALITLMAYLILGEVIVSTLYSLLPIEDEYIDDSRPVHSLRHRW